MSDSNSVDAQIERNVSTVSNVPRNPIVKEFAPMNLTSNVPDRPQAGDGQFEPSPSPLFLGTLSIVDTFDAWLCITHRCNHCRGE